MMKRSTEVFLDGKRHILIADDEFVNREMLENILCDKYHPSTEMDAVCFDVNHFHILIERFGTAKVAEILQSIADCLASVFSSSDGVLCKMGDDKNFEVLEQAIHAKDLDKAFEAAHSLKGVLGNLSLTPVYDPVDEVTALLRSRNDVDYTTYLKAIADKRDELTKLL